MAVQRSDGDGSVKTVDVVVRETDASITKVSPQLVSAAELVAVRVFRTYIQSLLGFIVVGTVLGGIPFVDNPVQAMDFLHKLLGSASLAVAPAAISLLQNVLELLAKVDVNNPRVRA